MHKHMLRRHPLRTYPSADLLHPAPQVVQPRWAVTATSQVGQLRAGVHQQGEQQQVRQRGAEQRRPCEARSSEVGSHACRATWGGSCLNVRP